MRILIVHPEGNTLHNPTLTAMLDLCAEHDCSMVVLGKRRPGGQDLAPHVMWIRESKWFWLFKNMLLRGSFCAWFVRFICFMQYLMFLRLHPCDLVLGVDREGVIQGSWFARMLNTQYGLLSFEITFEQETSREYKQLEREACRKIAFVLSQDRLRMQQLLLENKINNAEIFCLPIATRGPRSFSAEPRLRDVLGIPKDKNVAIMMGTVADWTLSDVIVKGISDWPEDWVLFVHDRYGNTRKKLQACGMNEKDYQRVVFCSSTPLDSAGDLSYLLSGVRAGIAFYRMQEGHPLMGNNIRFMGKSSGKISTYLQHGIPIIVNSVGGWASDVRKYDLGVVVEDERSLGAALAGITDKQRGNCLRFFAEYMDFANYQNTLWDLIERYAGCHGKR